MREGASIPSRLGLALATAISLAACADTVRPVLGGLKIGPAAAGPFTYPALLGEQPPFEYPEEAWARGVGGETLLKIHISRIGHVDSVYVARSSGDGALDSAAVAGARRLRYRPARQGEEPVAVWGLLPVQYPMPEAVKPGDRKPR